MKEQMKQQVEKLLQEITATSGTADIEKIAKRMGEIDNEITGAALRDILNAHFANTLLANAVAELEKLAAQKSSDHQLYKAILDNIVRGGAPSTNESKSELASIDISEDNRKFVLQLITLLKGLYQRSVYNNANGGWSGKLADKASQSYTSYTRLEIATHFETAANAILSRVPAAPVVVEEKTAKKTEDAITTTLKGIEQKVQQLKVQLAATLHPADINITDILGETYNLKKALDVQHQALFAQKVQASKECKQYQTDLDILIITGKISDAMLATVATDNDEKLQSLVVAYQSGRKGSYLSPTAWSHWYSLDATTQDLSEELQTRLQTKISAAKAQIKDCTEAMRHCGSLVLTATSLEQHLVLTKELYQNAVNVNAANECIKRLDAEIAKLSSGWAKVTSLLTRTSSEREEYLKLKVEARNTVLEAKAEFQGKLSSSHFSLFNSANPNLLRQPGNAPIPALTH